MTVQSYIPLVIGITGHRDVVADDIPVLQAAVRAELTQLREMYASSRIILLTALAEGADRIAAHAALEAGVEVGAVLPMLQLEYEADFQTDASIREFRELLAAAHWTHVVPASAKNPGAIQDRAQQYLEAGIYIARHSQLLFALWDGDTIEKKGGTSHIVRLYQSGQYSDAASEDLLSLPDSGPVIRIATRRTSDTSGRQMQPVGTVEFLPPCPVEPAQTVRHGDASSVWERERWKRVLARMDQFNRDTQNFLAQHPRKIEQSRQYLLGDSALALTDSARNALEIYEVADAMSAHGNTRRLSLFRQIIAIAMLSVFFESLYSGPFMYWPLLALCMASGLAAYGIFRKLRTERLEEQYLDYRALAEGARVQFFWKQAGLPDNAADHYLKEQRDELEWIRQALRCLELPRTTPNDPIQVSSIDGVRFALDHWVRDQYNYFAGKRQKAQANQLADESISKRAKTLFIAGASLLAFTALFQIFAASKAPSVTETVLQTCIVGYNLLLWALPAVKLYGEIMAYSEQAKRYKKMGYYFGICEQHLTRSLADGNAVRAVELLRQMGRHALVENGDWLLLHRQRPVQVPLVE